ncbi:hypothetical protein HDV57DRAFT_242018 [Trichoderma longibrachiatum]
MSNMRAVKPMRWRRLTMWKFVVLRVVHVSLSQATKQISAVSGTAGHLASTKENTGSTCKRPRGREHYVSERISRRIKMTEPIRPNAARGETQRRADEEAEKTQLHLVMMPLALAGRATCCAVLLPFNKAYISSRAARKTNETPHEQHQARCRQFPLPTTNSARARVTHAIGSPEAPNGGTGPSFTY